MYQIAIMNYNYHRDKIAFKIFGEFFYWLVYITVKVSYTIDEVHIHTETIWNSKITDVWYTCLLFNINIIVWKPKAKGCIGTIQVQMNNSMRHYTHHSFKISRFEFQSVLCAF